LEVKDKLDLLLEKMGINQPSGIKVEDIKAPMPGLIIDIKVIEEQEVEQGEAIMILEAMKMENILKSPQKGIIKTIKVKKGQSVEKNQILIQF
jgi:biotin carboxyl carrier protein